MGRHKKRNNLNKNFNRSISMQILSDGVKIEYKASKKWEVRKTYEGSSVYTCPGCYMPINQGQMSLTVIEMDHIFGQQAAIDERRHWHEGCWKRYN